MKWTHVYYNWARALKFSATGNRDSIDASVDTVGHEGSDRFSRSDIKLSIEKTKNMK